MLTGNAKWGAFYNSECFALPSHQENFGIAIVEAMSCQKPVLITDKVNIWREIEADGGGLICKDNETEIYETLKKWLSFDDKQKISIGHNAQQSYKKHFTVTSFAEKLSDIFRNA